MSSGPRSELGHVMGWYAAMMKSVSQLVHAHGHKWSVYSDAEVTTATLLKKGTQNLLKTPTVTVKSVPATQTVICRRADVTQTQTPASVRLLGCVHLATYGTLMNVSVCDARTLAVLQMELKTFAHENDLRD